MPTDFFDNFDNFNNSADFTDFDDTIPHRQVRLLTGQAGCGKTQAAIDAVLSERMLRAFDPIWVLLATDRQIHSFRDRLQAAGPSAVQFGVEFFNVHTLYHRVLELAHLPQRLIGDTARYGVLRHVIAEAQAEGALRHFGAIASTPGFVRLAAGLIDELKQGLVFPDDFGEAAAQRSDKDRDLALIYERYQRLLNERQLVDRHGAGWVAVEALERNPALAQGVRLLVVDGFDQFNRVHTRLITRLAGQVAETLLTLTQVEGPHRARFRRFAQVQERINAEDPSLWQVASLPPCADDLPPALAHLRQHVFEPLASQVGAGGAVRLIEAPDRGREVAAVMQRVKRLLLEGVPPDAIAVVARRLDGYAGRLRRASAAAGVPLVVRQGLRLGDNPGVAVLLDLIDLADRDFPRRLVLDTLTSPYVRSPDLDEAAITRLVHLSQQRQVVRGRDVWLAALDEAREALFDEDGEPRGDALDPGALAALSDGLRAHFDRVTPPERGTVERFTDWIMALIGDDPAALREDAAEPPLADADPAAGDPVADSQHGAGPDASSLGIMACIRAAGDQAAGVPEGPADDYEVRDAAAMKAFWRVLANLRAAHDLLAGDGDLPEQSWGEFRAELALALEQAAVEPPGGQSRLGRVLATDVRELRGLPHDYVFVLGLAEDAFPEPQPDDPPYTAGERAELAQAGIAVETVPERADDLSLFYQAVGVTRQGLTLSRYRIDDRGNEIPPSPYWNAVRAVVDIPDDDVMRIPVGAAPRLEAAASVEELTHALGAALAGEDPAISPEAIRAAHNALLAQPGWAEDWRHVLAGRALEAGREDPARPYDHTCGVLRDPTVAATELDGDHLWSASQFNELGTCPFRFFARRLLALEKLDDPEEGVDRLQLGSIYHAILEDAYRRCRAKNLTIGPENQDRALKILDEAAEAILRDAPTRYGFRASAVWQHEQADILRRLRALVRLDFSADSPLHPASDGRQRRLLGNALGDGPRQPFGQEARFGRGNHPPLVLDGPAGPLRVQGIIDRIDRVGDQVVIVDYKSGTARRSTQDIADGVDVQMLVYWRAAQAVILADQPGLSLVGGLFWHIHNGAASGEVLHGFNHDVLDLGQERLHVHVMLARQGNFAVRPARYNNGACMRTCDYAQMCRVQRGYLRKPDPADRPNSADGLG